MVKRLAVLALVLLVAGCGLPRRASPVQPMPDMNVVAGNQIGEPAVGICETGWVVITSYMTKKDEPGWRTIILGDSETTEAKPAVILEYAADEAFVAVYFDYDADGIVDKKIVDIDAAIKEVDGDTSACGIAAYVMSKRGK